MGSSKKILYIAQAIGKTLGVRKKVLAQSEAMKKLGYEVCLFSWGNITVPFDKKPQIDRFEFFEIDGINDGNGFFNVLKRRYTMFPHLFRLTNEFKPDIIYLRYPLADPIWILYLAYARKFTKKIYIEFNTLELAELKSQNSRFGYICEKIFGGAMRSFADTFVAVTPQILDEEFSRSFGKHKGVVMGNGYDPNDVQIKRHTELKGELHILGVANVAPWHGYDRIITGMAEYKGPYKIIFHLVGGMGTGEIERLRKLADSLNVKDVIFYGQLHGKELEDLFDISHVAVGSHGGHRKNGLFTSELKLREYCSKGIPFFLAVKDCDFEDCDFVLTTPSGDAPVDLSEVCRFVENIYRRQGFESKIRSYAENNLTWFKKLGDVLSNNE